MDSKLTHSYSKLMMLLRNYHRSYLEEFNLFLGQPKILKMLKENPGISQQELTCQIGVAKETISVSVRRLMKNELIKREIDVKDKRKFNLFLTEKGFLILDKVEQGIRVMNEDLLKGFNQQDKELMSQFIDRMIKNLEDNK